MWEGGKACEGVARLATAKQRCFTTGEREQMTDAGKKSASNAGCGNGLVDKKEAAAP